MGAFKTAFENPEFRRHITDYPLSAVSRPHLFRKVSVPGICVSGSAEESIIIDHVGFSVSDYARAKEDVIAIGGAVLIVRSFS